MESIRSLPFLKLLIPLILGILLGNYFLQSNWIYFFTFLFLSLCLFLYIHHLKSHSKQGIYLKALALFIHILCWGFFLSKYQSIHPHTKKEQTLLIIKEAWKKKNNYYQCYASTISSDIFKGGDILIRIKTDTKPIATIGGLILTNREIKTIQAPQNPFQFNYKKYLERKGIAYSLYLKEEDFILIKKNEFHLKIEFLSLRNKIELILDSSSLHPHSLAFIKALFLGDKSELDGEISEAFTIAGATHVLAVSGLHVGIIVSLFSALLSLIRSKKHKGLVQVLKILLLLLIIWTFAGITGFSPSIVRASIMFSFISIGQLMTRHTNIYNSLAMAAFFMLLIDANYLFDVGFQLSFLAVLGIVYFHPIIYKLFYIKNILLQKVWSISAVSLAAQLVTFPIAIYYFHQFPVYFLFSNIIVIPAAFIVLLLSILLLFFHWINFLSSLLSYILNTIIDLLNYLMLAIQKLPFNSIQNLSLNIVELIILFLILFTFTLFIKNRNAKTLIVLLSIICIFFSIRLVHKIENSHSNEMLIYSIYKHSAINLIQHSTYTLFLDSMLIKTPEKLNFPIENHLLDRGLKAIEESNKVTIEKVEYIEHSTYLKSPNHLILDKTLLCFNHSSHNSSSLNFFSNRILFIDQQKFMKDLELDNYSHLVINIWNKSNSKLLIALENLQDSIEIHSIMEDGYFRISLP